MKTRRKLIAVAAAVLLCLPVGLTNDNTAVVHAQTVQEKINNASKEKQEALDKIKAAEAEKEDVVAESEALDREIDIVQTEIYEIDSIIDEADAEIKAKEEEIAKHEQNIEQHNDEFKEVLRSMDETSASSYLELLLSSESFSEFLAHVETINEITRHDTAVIDEMVSLKNSVEAAKAVGNEKKRAGRGQGNCLGKRKHASDKVG